MKSIAGACWDLEYKDLGIKLKHGYDDPPPEIQEKLVKSFLEAVELKERKLACPVCKSKLGSIYSDGCGHVNVKCQKCGFASPMNLAYFRRKRKKLSFEFVPGGGEYKSTV